MKYILIIVGIIVVIGVGFGIHTYLKDEGDEGPHNSPLVTTGDNERVTTVDYACDAEKSIHATFHEGKNIHQQEGSRPQPQGSVDLTLSDGRTLTLKQTISASGVRYSDGDPDEDGSERFVFWSKGNGALILENNEEKSFINCITVSEEKDGLSEVYQSGELHFTVRYPYGWGLDSAYIHRIVSANNSERGDGKNTERSAHGVKFIVPSELVTGTNLSADSGVSVESLGTSTCNASLFLDGTDSNSTTTIGDSEYTVATSSGAGAGNIYSETVYARTGTRECIGVRYLTHSTQLGNYPEGTVKAFDERALSHAYDAIRDSLTVAE